MKCKDCKYFNQFDECCSGEENACSRFKANNELESRIDRDKLFTVYRVEESDPFYGNPDYTYFFYEGEAEDYYEELCDSQGGRSSYDDDEGGMDYSMEELELTYDEMVEVFGEEEVLDMLLEGEEG
ncbi:MAG: hypothetical protein HUJ68_09845 [Clostridia bacterium]|nr:hypothetical protein [Clostridia bacterium]